MKYQRITKAVFLERPNRFIAIVEINGKNETVHVKNTGRCRELLIEGATVYLEDFVDRMGTRKLRYSLIAVEKKVDNNILLINMDSQVPNKLAYEALSSGLVNLQSLDKLTVIKPEMCYGNSRIDFYLEDINGKKAFLEVKGCTLEDHGEASFPDAPTERGVKHINELIEARKNGYETGILFVIQMKEMKYFMPADDKHKAFGDALRKAAKEGVEILAWECDVHPDKVEIIKSVPLKNIL